MYPVVVGEVYNCKSPGCCSGSNPNGCVCSAATQDLLCNSADPAAGSFPWIQYCACDPIRGMTAGCSREYGLQPGCGQCEFANTAGDGGATDYANGFCCCGVNSGFCQSKAERTVAVGSASQQLSRLFRYRTWISGAWSPVRRLSADVPWGKLREEDPMQLSRPSWPLRRVG